MKLEEFYQLLIEDEKVTEKMEPLYKHYIKRLFSEIHGENLNSYHVREYGNAFLSGVTSTEDINWLYEGFYDDINYSISFHAGWMISQNKRAGETDNCC